MADKPMANVQEVEVAMASRKEGEKEFESVSALLYLIDRLGGEVKVPKAILRAAEDLRIAVMRCLNGYNFLQQRRTFVNLDVDEDTGPDKVAELLKGIVALNDIGHFTHAYHKEMVDFCNAVRSELIPLLQGAKEKGVFFRGLVGDYRSAFGFTQPELGAAMFTFASMAACVFVLRAGFGNLLGRNEGIGHDPIELLFTLAAASMPVWFKVPQKAYAVFLLIRECTTELSRIDKLADHLEDKLQEVLEDTERREKFTNVFFCALETRREIGHVVFTYPEFSKIVGEKIDELCYNCSN